MSGKINMLICLIMFILFSMAIDSCEHKSQEIPVSDGVNQFSEIPSFITPVKKYFNVNIQGNHTIDSASYRLKISGGVNHPSEFSLVQLRDLPMVEKTVTVECINNYDNGELIGTVKWKGFNLINFWKSGD